MKHEDYFLNCHTEESISIRFKSLAKKYHPDVNKAPEATKIFQEVNKQREASLRVVLSKSGKSDTDINDYISSMMKRDFKAADSLAEDMLDEFLQKNGDKEPNFADVLNFTMKKYFGGLSKKSIDKNSPGQAKRLD